MPDAIEAVQLKLSGFDLPVIYNELLPVTRDSSRETSDQSALTIVVVAGRSLTK